jgi:hypothetical protein
MTERAGPDAPARFSEAARVIVFIVGALYVLGLLIVTVDLSRYGIVHLDLARPEYVLSGALWVVVVLAPVVASVFGLLNAREFVRQRSSKGLGLAAVGIVALGLVMPVVLMQFFSSPTGPERMMLGVTSC